MREVVIIGAGVAGLATAAVLSQRGHDVVVFEKQPRAEHRVCGEYLSNEARPFLKTLGVDLDAFGACPLETLQWTTSRGTQFSGKLTPGGVGLSRLRLDTELAARAEAFGARVVRGAEVREAAFEGSSFRVRGKHPDVQARVVIGCYGKRSGFDHNARSAPRSDYLAVKQHYAGVFPASVVSLNSFPGGYCGVSRVEDDRVNVCYLARASAVRAHGGLANFEQNVVRKNLELSARLNALTPIFARPLVVAQLNFSEKAPVDKHVLMAGDAARLVHPFSGNGMALALRSAKLGADAVSQFLSGQTTRTELEDGYALSWREGAHARVAFGNALHRLFEVEALSEFGCKAARLLPRVAERVLGLSQGSQF